MNNFHIFFLFIIILVVTLFLYFQFSVKKDQMVIRNADNMDVDVKVEMADTQLKKMKGLMFRDSLPENEGMLFVFDRQGIYSFWMINTSIPLDALFFDSKGELVDVISMEPCKVLNCPKYSPKSPAKYVLEVNKGFAKRHNLISGKSRIISCPDY